MGKYSIRHDKSEAGGGYLADGKVALGLTIGLLSAVLLIVLLGGKLADLDFNSLVDITPILISILVAGASTFLAARALSEQGQAREAATDPVLVAHFGQREDARDVITLNVTNVGAGAAIKVELDVEEPDDDLMKRDLFVNVFVKHHIFSVIPQNRSVQFSLGFGWDLLGENPLPPFSVTLRYEDLAGGRYRSDFTLDVREMEKLSADKSPEMRMVDALEKIAKNSG
ncbi:hypothetical protein MACH17_06830 [Phaeobacter inhibens]|uniref:hypothetical protein n=1 Tax=Phaeobacter inhibens TaxID=221822 RepID=UPI000C9AE64F|nr:hypothetical protein [Phaeobacter inhibens]AUQ55399.1 hypothetical protein PhaeoP92_02749 [Phaeobacter inhibens]AUQ71575.1 hypothetical protein PhaeoP54_02712 [Phaeobacter inhibens]AUQ79415.1 hypothetical protein PhaeoP74_02750 [Phaeobacter inhibens]AUR16574.1 hypothetical protein PhaeoP70_02748 [Phaeobacter inhibens]GLO69166.1 hypothetical protein MACH17_06830 [Phaeobacter inhibens]